MLKGAEIILTPNACTLDEVRLTPVRVRAYENQVGVAMANYATPRQRPLLHLRPIVYLPGGVARDTLIIMAGEQEGIFLADFDLEALREYRSRESWGNVFASRRGYRVLVSPEVEEPFVRVSASGEEYHRVRSGVGREVVDVVCTRPARRIEMALSQIRNPRRCYPFNNTGVLPVYSAWPSMEHATLRRLGRLLNAQERHRVRL